MLYTNTNAVSISTPTLTSQTSRRVLDRYLHHFMRFAEHENSAKLEGQLEAHICKFAGGARVCVCVCVCVWGVVVVVVVVVVNYISTLIHAHTRTRTHR